MALIKCSECHAEVSDKAEACPKCGNPLVKAAPKKQVGTGAKVAHSALAIVLGAVAIVVFLGYQMSGTSESTPTASAQQQTQAAAPEEPPIPAPERNAVRSAKEYLSMEGFSREGLIRQLSSNAGEGYDVADATAAVDSLGVDWNEQAVRSAKEYLSIQGFSCNGLIRQLSSSAGSGYTIDQAKYGAKQAGAC